MGLKRYVSSALLKSRGGRALCISLSICSEGCDVISRFLRIARASRDHYHHSAYRWCYFVVQSILPLCFQQSYQGIQLCSFFTEILNIHVWCKGKVRHVAEMPRGFHCVPASLLPLREGRGQWLILTNGLWEAVISVMPKSKQLRALCPQLSLSFLWGVIMEPLSR